MNAKHLLEKLDAHINLVLDRMHIRESEAELASLIGSRRTLVSSIGEEQWFGMRERQSFPIVAARIATENEEAKKNAVEVEQSQPLPIAASPTSLPKASLTLVPAEVQASAQDIVMSRDPTVPEQLKALDVLHRLRQAGHNTAADQLVRGVQSGALVPTPSGMLTQAPMPDCCEPGEPMPLQEPDISNRTLP